MNPFLTRVLDCYFMTVAQITKLQDALTSIKGGHVPHGSMPSFEEMKEILGFNSYYEEEKVYATSSQLSS